MFLGVVKAAADTSTEFSKNEIAKPLHDLNAPENRDVGLLSLVEPVWAFGSFLTDAIEQITRVSWIATKCSSVVRTAWSDTLMQQTI